MKPKRNCVTLFIILLIIATGFLGPSPFVKGQSTEVSVELVGAVEALDRGNYDSALETLSGYNEKQPLGSYSDLLIARARIGQGEFQKALEALKRFQPASEQELFRFQKKYLEAKAQLRLGRLDRAASLAEEASGLAETSKEREKLIQLKLSIARKRGNSQEALSQVISLMEVTNLRFIGERRDELFDLAENLVEETNISKNGGSQYLFRFVEKLVDYREYRRARSLLLRNMGSFTGETKVKAYFRLAWLDGLKLDYPEESIWTFQRLFQAKLSRSMEAKGRYYEALTKNGFRDNYDLTGQLLGIYERFPETYFGRLAVGRAFERVTKGASLQELDSALEQYKSRLSRSAVRSATWRLFFKSYERGNYKLALDYTGYLESYYDELPPELFFWRRKARIASPDVDPRSYIKVVSFQENNPTNYYALLAGKNGWSRQSFKISETWSQRSVDLEEVETRLLESNLSSSLLRRLKLTLSLKNHGLLASALASLERLKSNLRTSDYLYLKLQWEKLAENYRESLKAATRLTGWYYDRNQRPPIEVVRAAYPRYYSRDVKRVAGKYGLSESLIYAVIRQESAFDSEAYSTAKAVGLTQVIPSTAEGIAEDLGVDDFTPEDLFNPSNSIEFGSFYINKQLGRFSDIRLGLTAYHGGPGNLGKWKEEFTTSDVDLFVERIPLGSTRNYVKSVYRNYLVYSQLY